MKRNEAMDATARGNPVRRPRGTLAMLVLLVVSACGGGGASLSGAGGVGTGGTGMSTGLSSGTVTGFGSLVLDGQPYSSATPLYFAGTAQDESAATAAAAVQLGQQLQIQLDAQGVPSAVLIDPQLVGALALQPAGGFTVNGVPVRVTTAPTRGPVTYYAGVAGAAALAGGMQVEVHGAFAIDPGTGQGYLQATLVEQLPATNTVTRITGVVADLAASGNSFRLGTTPVQLAPAAKVLPVGTALANGRLVTVWSNQAPLGGVVSAGAVRVSTLQGSTGTVQLGGLVSALAGTAFQVDGIAVDASAPALAAQRAALAAGQYVVVTGTAAGDTLQASRIAAYAVTPASAVTLHGTITGYVGIGNFLVRGVPVNAAGATLAPAGTALANGLYVEVGGSVQGNQVAATAVTVQSQPPIGSTVDYVGTVGQLDGVAKTFVLTLKDGTTRQVALAPNLAYDNGSAAQLVNGASVEVEATATGGANLLAYSVQFRALASPSAPPATTETSGVAYDVGATSFAVNGLTILINNVVPRNGTLANGVRVEVDFVTTQGQNLAQDISIDH